MRHTLGLKTGNPQSKHTTYKLDFAKRAKPPAPEPEPQVLSGQHRRLKARYHEAPPGESRRPAPKPAVTEYSRQFTRPKVESRTVASGTDLENLDTVSTKALDDGSGGVDHQTPRPYPNRHVSPRPHVDRADIESGKRAGVDPKDLPPAGIASEPNAAMQANIDHVAALLGPRPVPSKRRTEAQAAYKWPAGVTTETTAKPSAEVAVWVSANLDPANPVVETIPEVSTYRSDYAWPKPVATAPPALKDRRVQIGNPGETIKQVHEYNPTDDDDNVDWSQGGDDDGDSENDDTDKGEAGELEEMDLDDAGYDYNDAEGDSGEHDDDPVAQDVADDEGDFGLEVEDDEVEQPRQPPPQPRAKGKLHEQPIGGGRDTAHLVSGIYATEYSERFKAPDRWLAEQRLASAQYNKCLSSGSDLSPAESSDSGPVPVPTRIRAAAAADPAKRSTYSSAFHELRARASEYQTRSRRSELELAGHLNTLRSRQDDLLARARRKPGVRVEVTGGYSSEDVAKATLARAARRARRV